MNYSKVVSESAGKRFGLSTKTKRSQKWQRKVMYFM